MSHESLISRKTPATGQYGNNNRHLSIFQLFHGSKYNNSIRSTSNYTTNV